MAAKGATEAFSTTCAGYIEDCGDWWLSGCHGSVAGHWRLKPQVSWVQFPAASGLFTLILYLHLITSKIIYFQMRQDALSSRYVLLLLGKSMKLRVYLNCLCPHPRTHQDLYWVALVSSFVPTSLFINGQVDSIKCAYCQVTWHLACRQVRAAFFWHGSASCFRD